MNSRDLLVSDHRKMWELQAMGYFMVHGKAASAIIAEYLLTDDHDLADAEVFYWAPNGLLVAIDTGFVADHINEWVHFEHYILEDGHKVVVK